MAYKDTKVIIEKKEPSKIQKFFMGLSSFIAKGVAGRWEFKITWKF